MPNYKITNVTHEHKHALKRRMASRLQMEPVIAGGPLRLRASRMLTDAQFENNKTLLAQLERDGVITVVADIEAKVAKPFVPPLVMPPEPPPVPVLVEDPVVIPPQEPDPLPVVEPPPVIIAPPVQEVQPEAPMPSAEPLSHSSGHGHRKGDKKQGR